MRMKMALLAILISLSRTSQSLKSAEGWVTISRPPKKAAPVLGQVLKDGNRLGIPWIARTRGKVSTGVNWIDSTREETQEEEPRSWAEIVGGRKPPAPSVEAKADKPDEDKPRPMARNVEETRSEPPAQDAQAEIPKEEEVKLPDAPSEISEEQEEVAVREDAKLERVEEDAEIEKEQEEEAVGPRTSDPHRMTSNSRYFGRVGGSMDERSPRHTPRVRGGASVAYVSRATVPTSAAARLGMIRNCQMDSDKLNKRFSLISPITLAQVRETPEGLMTIVASEQLVQLRRAVPREAYKVLLNGKSHIVKIGDIESDMSLFNEFTILKLIEGHGIGPLPRFLSPPYSTYTRVPRYIVTEYLGPSLGSFHEFSKPSPRQIVVICLDALRLIRKLHSLGVAHGSLDEFNFTVLPQGGLRLTDFELSHFLPEPYRDKTVTNPYFFAAFVSPWELERTEYSRRDDLFRWIEMTARLLLGSHFVISLLNVPENLLHWHKSFVPYFSVDSMAWLSLSDRVRPLAQLELNAILSYIRGLRVHDAPNYTYLDYHMESVVNLFSE